MITKKNILIFLQLHFITMRNFRIIRNLSFLPLYINSFPYFVPHPYISPSCISGQNNCLISCPALWFFGGLRYIILYLSELRIVFVKTPAQASAISFEPLSGWSTFAPSGLISKSSNSVRSSLFMGK